MNHFPGPTRPGLSVLAAARDFYQRQDDSSALDASAGALETAYQVLARQLGALNDDAGVRLVENMLQVLEVEAARMRVRASDIGGGL